MNPEHAIEPYPHDLGKSPDAIGCARKRGFPSGCAAATAGRVWRVKFAVMLPSNPVRPRVRA
jgi:hypothetical protein